jgi:hypothetical protein
MKNIFKSAVYLTTFALAGILFQISCSNSSSVSSTTSTPVGKIIYNKFNATGFQIWSCNYDGTNPTQILINLPANVILNNHTGYTSSSQNPETNIKISPDNQKIFFQTITNPNQTNMNFSIYSCDLTGNNVTEVIAQNVGENPLQLGCVY